jgi:hypothetical protein
MVGIFQNVPVVAHGRDELVSDVAASFGVPGLARKFQSNPPQKGYGPLDRCICHFTSPGIASSHVLPIIIFCRQVQTLISVKVTTGPPAAWLMGV